MSHLELVALVVRDYDAAIDFFVDVLKFRRGGNITNLPMRLESRQAATDHSAIGPMNRERPPRGIA